MNKEMSLQGIKGIAAIMVVLNHYILAFIPNFGTLYPAFNKYPFYYLWNGRFAVYLFFIASGYGISYYFFRTNDDQYIKNNAIKRYFKLMIPMLVSILFAYCLMKLNLFYHIDAAKLTSSQWLADHYNFQPNFIDAIKQAFFGIFIGNGASYNSVLWTMQYELSGGYIVYAVLLLFGKIKHRSIIYLILCLYFRNTYYLAFLLGMILSDTTSNDKNIIAKYNASYVLLAIGICLGMFAKINGNRFFYDIIIAFLLITSIISIKKLKYLFINKILLFLGNISLSIYLFHWIILNTFSCWIFIYLKTMFTYKFSFVIMFFCSLALIIVFAKCINKKITCFSNKIADYCFKKIFADKLI